MSLIAHVDMDSFFVSVERERDPSLIGKPVAVGGASRRGVIASASYEAREYGVHSAMPTLQAMKACPELIIVPAHGSLYSERSRQIFSVLEKLSPVVEPVSIDEAYLDMSGTQRLYGEPPQIARRIREEILEKTGLSASVGIASVRHVAKMASVRAKPAGTFCVPPGEEARFLAGMPLRALPGLGPSAEQKLLAMGIRTLGQLAARDPDEMERRLGQWGREVVLRSRGEGSATLSTHDEVKSVGKEITFYEDTGDLDELEAVLLSMAERIASRLRRKELLARTVTLKLREPSFRTWTRARTLEVPTCDEKVIFEIARETLRKELRGGLELRLLGVTCGGLCGTPPPVQQGLFDAAGRGALEPAAEERAELAAAVDKIRERYGFDALRRATTLVAKDRPTQDNLTGKGSLREEMPAGFRGALRDSE